MGGAHILRPEWQRHSADGQVTGLRGWLWQRPDADDYVMVSANWWPSACLGGAWLAVALLWWLAGRLPRHPNKAMQPTGAPSGGG
jgi:hypothetical protein